MILGFLKNKLKMKNNKNEPKIMYITKQTKFIGND